MPTIQFLPWCRVARPCTAGDVHLIPFEHGHPPEGLDAPLSSQIEAILTSYRDLDGRPVRRAALVGFGAKRIVDDLTEDEIEITHECVELVCFSSLAQRDFFNDVGPYSNSACFILYRQNFRADSHFVGLTTRRREGRTLNGRSLASTVITIPVQVSPISTVAVDEALLAGLGCFRDCASSEIWSRWQNAISCFNQANTDDDSTRYQAEWTFLCGAFERILNAQPNAEDVAAKFEAALQPVTPLKVGSARRKSDRWKNMEAPLRYEWMKEFYRIRGDFAHGRLDTRQPQVWRALEHLVLASVSFPLVVRQLLHREGTYDWTDEDWSQLDAFEALADSDFLNPPENQHSSMDSVWSRLRQKARWDRVNRQVAAELERCPLSDESKEPSE